MENQNTPPQGEIKTVTPSAQPDASEVETLKAEINQLKAEKNRHFAKQRVENKNKGSVAPTDNTVVDNQPKIRERVEKLEARERALNEQTKKSAITSAAQTLVGNDSKNVNAILSLALFHGGDKIKVNEKNEVHLYDTDEYGLDKVIPISDYVKTLTAEYPIFVAQKATPSVNAFKNKSTAPIAGNRQYSDYSQDERLKMSDAERKALFANSAKR